MNACCLPALGDAVLGTRMGAELLDYRVLGRKQTCGSLQAPQKGHLSEPVEAARSRDLADVPAAFFYKLTSTAGETLYWMVKLWVKRTPHIKE